MIGILIEYKGKYLFTALPKENDNLEKQLANIGLNIKPQDMQISNKTELGYSIEIYAQDTTEMEIAAKICNTDTLGRLNDLMQFIDKEYITDLYDIAAYGDSESVEELYRKLTTPPKPEVTDNLIIKTNLNHKATYYEPSDCLVEKVISLPTEEFQHLLNEPLDSYDFINEVLKKTGTPTKSLGKIYINIWCMKGWAIEPIYVGELPTAPQSEMKVQSYE